MIIKFDTHNIKCGIYGIYIDDKLVYIGQSKQLQARAYNHEQKIRKGYGPPSLWYQLANSFYRHGHKITFKVLEEVVEDQLIEKENEYINRYLPIFNGRINFKNRAIPTDYNTAAALLGIKTNPLKEKSQIVNEERAAAIGWFGEFPPIRERI